MRNEIEQTLRSERVALHEWFKMKTKRPTFKKKNQLNYWNRNVLTSPEGDG